jgi:hypothetical protein
MDNYIKSLYPDLLKYNKQVGGNVYLLAAKQSGSEVAAGAMSASV